MDGSPSWAGLPSEVLLEIVRRIPCAFDRVHVHAICRSWREMLQQLLPRPPPPGILFLRADGPTLSCITGDGWCTHPVFIPDAFRRARYFGSYNDSWLFLATGQRNGHALFNLSDLQEIEQPNTGPYQSNGREFEAGILIVAAALSSSPNVYGCISGGIVTIDDRPPHNSLGYIAIWRTSSDVISEMIRPNGEVPAVEDVIYHDGAFHFLTRGPDERIIVCRASTPESPDMAVLVNYEVDVSSAEERNIVPRDPLHQFIVVASYLVESRGFLLMVEKLAPDLLSPASAFRVFQLEEDMLDGQVLYIWDELRTLDGRMLFIGRGCSRSYEAAHYPGLEAGIYFLDDRCRHDPNIPFQDAPATRQYPCSDTGKWSGTPPQIKLLVPDSGPSNYSPPVWFLP